MTTVIEANLKKNRDKNMTHISFITKADTHSSSQENLHLF